jgi:replicative DNA helicase
MHTAELLDRLPPQNLDAERCVLGSILLLPTVLDELGAVVRPQDFYADANHKLFAHLQEMHDTGRRIDAALLKARLQDRGDWEAIGGAAYIAEVTTAVPTACHAVHYAAIVAKAARRRALIAVGTEILRDGYAATEEPEILVDRAESLLAAIPAGEPEGEPVDVSQAAYEALQRLDDARNRQHSAGLMLGLPDVDDEIGGLFPGELTILAARPGVGKTSFALQVAYYAAAAGRRVLFASLEMSRVELTTRMACAQGGVSSHRVRCGKITAAESTALANAMNAVAATAMTIYDRPGLTVAAIRRAARRQARRGLALIVVDYLQLLTPPDRRVQRHEQVGAITAALKSLARELDLPVLCLCQLNREAEKLDRPGLANLRESGSIEQDADVVMFLCRPEKGFTTGTDRGPTDNWDAELIVAKNRNGECGKFQLDWQADATSFNPHKSYGYAEFQEHR